MNLLEKMIKYKNEHDERDTYYPIVCTILAHTGDINRLTIYDAAELCYTSTASIGRLCKLLGCSGYSEFKLALYRDAKTYLYDHQPLPAAKKGTSGIRQRTCEILRVQADWLEALQDIWLEEIAKFFKIHQKIVLFDFVGSSEYVRLLSINLLIDHKEFIYCQNLSQQETIFEEMKTEKNILYVFSVSNINGNAALKGPYLQAYSNGMDTLLLKNGGADGQLSFLADDRHPVLQIPGYEISLDMVFWQCFWIMIAMVYRENYLDDENRIYPARS